MRSIVRFRAAGVFAGLLVATAVGVAAFAGQPIVPQLEVMQPAGWPVIATYDVAVNVSRSGTAVQTSVIAFRGASWADWESVVRNDLGVTCSRFEAGVLARYDGEACNGPDPVLRTPEGPGLSPNAFVRPLGGLDRQFVALHGRGMLASDLELEMPVGLPADRPVIVVDVTSDVTCASLGLSCGGLGLFSQFYVLDVETELPVLATESFRGSSLLRVSLTGLETGVVAPD